MLGVVLTVAVGELVNSADERNGLPNGEGVAVTLVGAVHEISTTASSNRSIVGR
jgi:hypothetical protein